MRARQEDREEPGFTENSDEEEQEREKENHDSDWITLSGLRSAWAYISVYIPDWDLIERGEYDEETSEENEKTYEILGGDEEDKAQHEENTLAETIKKSYGTFNKAEGSTSSPTNWATLTDHPSTWDHIKFYIPSWHSIKYYLPSFNNFIIAFAAFTTSLPLLPFAFGFPTGTPPQEFSWDWFLILPLLYQVASIVNTVIFLGLETFIRYDHFAGLLNQLAGIIKSSGQSLTGALCLLANAFFSITAAAGGVGLGYLSYMWYPQLAIPSAVLNGGVVLAFRIEFMASFFDYIKSKFNEDTQFQLFILDVLKRLKTEYKEDFDTLFTNEEINTESAARFLTILFDYALETTHQIDGLFETPTTLDKTKDWLSNGLDAISASMFGTAFGGFFAINGYLGIEILCGLLSPECPLKELSHTEQIIIAIITGLSSAVLGFMTGLDLRSIVMATYEHMKKYPQDIAKLIAVLIGAGIPATTMYIAVSDILQRENVFGLSEGPLGTAFVATNTILIAAFCYKSLFNLFLKKEETVLNTETVINKLASEPLLPDVIAALKRHSFFTMNEKRNEEEIIVQPSLVLAAV